MAIINQITQSTREKILGVLQRDHLDNPSYTCMILDSMAERVTGPAGDGIGITDSRDIAAGRHYDGFDKTLDYGVPEAGIKHFANWSFFQSDVAISGPELQRNLGITSDVVMDQDRDMASLMPTDRLTLYSIAGERFSAAGDTISLTRAADFWGKPLPGDDEGRKRRRPESIVDIMDPLKPLHGMNNTDLGEWDKDLHPWYSAPPNNALPDDIKRQRHVPQVWDNDGTPRQLSKSAVTEPLLHMQSVGGMHICGIHPTLAPPFFSEFDDNDQGPVLLGYDTWRLGINCIQYLNCFFFLDNYAPTDSIYLIHVGHGMGAQQKRNPGYQTVFWVPPEEDASLRDVLHNNMMEPIEPGAVRLGYNDRMPLYQLAWDRLENYADAIGTRLCVQFSQVCMYRWKHIHIKDLEP